MSIWSITYKQFFLFILVYTCILLRGKPASETPIRIAVIGDAGATDASMLSIAHITQRVVDRSIDFLLHDGDIG